MKLELEKKILEEYRLKEEAESKIGEFEKEENEILRRLKSTTQVHKDCNYEFIILVCEEYENLSLKDINGKKNHTANKFPK
jgi:hypothetical protein